MDVYTEKQNKLRTLQYKLEQRLKGEVSKEETLSNGKIVLQVMSEMPQKADFVVSYITPNATWTPFYDLRAENINSTIKLSVQSPNKTEYRGGLETYQAEPIKWQP